MKEREQKRQAEKRQFAAIRAKAFLILGGLGFGISWVYASAFYAVPHRGRATWVDGIADVVHMASEETAGCILVLCSVLLLFFGIIDFKRSRK